MKSINLYSLKEPYSTSIRHAFVYFYILYSLSVNIGSTYFTEPFFFPAHTEVNHTEVSCEIVYACHMLIVLDCLVEACNAYL